MKMILRSYVWLSPIIVNYYSFNIGLQERWQGTKPEEDVATLLGRELI